MINTMVQPAPGGMGVTPSAAPTAAGAMWVQMPDGSMALMQALQVVPPVPQQQQPQPQQPQPQPQQQQAPIHVPPHHHQHHQHHQHQHQQPYEQPAVAMSSIVAAPDAPVQYSQLYPDTYAHASSHAVAPLPHQSQGSSHMPPVVGMIPSALHVAGPAGNM
jgi:hypothetical protein